jgi:hypothetical protein
MGVKILSKVYNLDNLIRSYNNLKNHTEATIKINIIKQFFKNIVNDKIAELIKIFVQLI